MFRLLPTTALALLLACSPGASQNNVAAPQPTATPSATAAAPTVDADPALWVVKDADTTVYLFGTVHVLKPGLSWFDEAVKKAFDASDQLVMELPDPGDPQIGALIFKLGTTTQGPTLTEKIPEAKRAAFAEALKDAGVPPTALDRFEPWAAALTLYSMPLLKSDFDPGSGAEIALLKAAKEAGKPVSGLETAEEQLGYFKSLPEKAQIDYLIETAGELDKVVPMLDQLVAAWQAGKPEELAALMNEGMDSSPEVAKVLLADRNARWAEWIEDRMKQPGTVFVAVGAGHLAGAESVQRQLEKAQLRAERVAY